MKMLCVDGGGIRGIIPIVVMVKIEEELKQPIGKYFDVVAGTSTGSIIGASIALGHPMNDVLKYYKYDARKIFKRQARVGLLKSVYKDVELRELLKRVFGERLMTDVDKPLLIPAVDLTHGNPYIHRSKDLEGGLKPVKLWDAVLSSCSAPVYFPPNNVGKQYLSVDGGLWANNPSLVCITEALHYFQKSLNDIKILSFGTGKQQIEFSHNQGKYWGLRQWMPLKFPSITAKPKLLDLALNLSSESVSYHSRLLLNQNYLRINKELTDEISFDEIERIEEMIDIGRQIYFNHREEIIKFIVS
ncbi:CBASS cGAMP-activated phospholipase [Halobacillus massiliensis]|uniref:CBASS cGAMP-activated phospholipase n=1 Tax=Halobacillus massiliensis TaxID=1926286 RepID=UPI0009E55CCE|nr:CBASS cGAMP-activated phospholipase [Halobacillus massiliensis]